MSSLRDTWLIGSFEVLRAFRTWRALALVLVFMVADAGATAIFVEALSEIEDQIAVTMGVATTEYPGSLMDEVMKSEQLREMVSFLVGGERVATDLLTWPILAICQLWVGLGMLPFLAATASSETIASDMATRTLRYEAARTGRAEIVAGRFLGQCALVGVATLGGLAATWVTAMATMVVDDPVVLATGLVALGGRAFFLGLPFIGLGVAASQLTTSTAWARVLAIVGTAGSWIAFWALKAADEPMWVTLADVVLPLLPQSYLQGLWAGGSELAVAAATCAGLACAWTALGFARFAGRDL
jgi:ABC-type transport system involved in multi-copper enzyme maturation permease subunit